MVLTETPVCEFGLPAPDFELESCTGENITLSNVKGEKGLLVVFMCNHCPYVQAILPRLASELKLIQELGVGCVAINSNDVEMYPEDSLENMQRLAEQYNFSFPYCLDETQEVGRSYKAVCTPDFFGYNSDLKLQYRGRFDSSGRNPADQDAKRELLEAMTMIADSGKGPVEQIPSMGCSIKWRN